MSSFQDLLRVCSGGSLVQGGTSRLAVFLSEISKDCRSSFLPGVNPISTETKRNCFSILRTTLAPSLELTPSTQTKQQVFIVVQLSRT